MEGDEVSRYNELVQKLQTVDLKNEKLICIKNEQAECSNNLANGDKDILTKKLEKKGEEPSTSKPTLEINGEQENVDDSSSEDEDDSSSEDEPIQAPLELLGEFLQYVRCGNWVDAKKLCKMILIYEPEHPLALQYQVIIEEKMQIEKELAEMESSSEEEEESSSEEDSSEENEGSGDENQEQEEEEEEEEDHREHLPNKLVFFNEPWKP